MSVFHTQIARCRLYVDSLHNYKIMKTKLWASGQICVTYIEKRFLYNSLLEIYLTLQTFYTFIDKYTPIQ